MWKLDIVRDSVIAIKFNFFIIIIIIIIIISIIIIVVSFRYS